MMLTVEPDWWKRLFDEIYLITDARSVCDKELTCKEIDFLVHVLRFDKSDSILDLCGGQGRHSLELSRRGFQNITVLDYSDFLIRLGKEIAEEEGLNIQFVRQDARDTGLPAQNYNIIIVMASSFGYFVDPEDDQKILREAFRLLIPEGSLLLDLPNQEYVLNNFTPQSWHEADQEMVVCRQRRLDGSVMYAREMVISKIKGLIRDETYCTRLYSGEEITALLTSAGFTSVNIQKDLEIHKEKADYGCMTNRMVVIATK